jgi:hypothetical protein
MAQNQYVEARAAFEAALLIHPHSTGIRRNIEFIDDYIGRNTYIAASYPSEQSETGSNR